MARKPFWTRVSLRLCVMLLLSALCLLIGVPVSASADEGTGSGSGSGTSAENIPPTPSDITKATGIHPDFSYSPEQCGAWLVAHNGTSLTDRVPDGCYGSSMDFGDLAYPTVSGENYDTQYFHFFSAEELYFCTTTTDSKGNTTTTALTERPADAGFYSLCINEYGSQNFQNGVNMYRKLTGYPDEALDKWVKVPDDDQTNFYGSSAGGVSTFYNVDTGDLSGMKFPKQWMIMQNPVAATLTGTSAVTFAKNGVASIDVSKYTLSLAVGSYNQVFVKMMPEPTGILASSLTLVDGDLELTGTGTDITSAGNPGSIGTMTVGTATDATANKRYTVQLSAQGQKHLAEYLQTVYARHDGQTPSSSVPANYRISSSTSSATLDVLTTSTLEYDKNAPTGHAGTEISGTIDPVTAAAGSAATVTDKTYALKGYTLTGWNSKADGSGKSYAAGSPITVVSPQTTLYAQWQANTYTLVYHANSSDGAGSGSAGDQTAEDSLTYDRIATLRGEGTFTRPGWHFTGWNTKADGTGTSYPAGEEITAKEVDTLVGSLPADGKVNLYAQWVRLDATLPRTGSARGRMLPLAAGVLLLLGCGAVVLWRRLQDNPVNPRWNGGGR